MRAGSDGIRFLLLPCCGMLLLSILVAPCPPGSPSPAFRLERKALDLGGLSRGEVRDVFVLWWREGTGALRVNGVAADCGCVLPTPLPDVLDEGARGALRIRVRARRAPGPFRHHVQIVVGGVLSRLALTGFVERELGVTPASLELGPRPPGALVHRRFEVFAAGPTPHLEGVHVTLEGLEGAAVVGPSHHKHGRSRTLAVDLRLPLEVGPFSGAVLVTPGAGPPLRARVTGRVVSTR